VVEAFRRVLLGLLCCTLCPLVPGGEAEPVRAEVLVDRGAELAVGDACALTLLYRWPTDWTVVERPDPAADFADLETLELEPVEPVTVGGERIESWRMRVLVPRSGVWELPRTGLTVRDFRLRMPVGDDAAERWDAEATLTYLIYAPPTPSRDRE